MKKTHKFWKQILAVASFFLFCVLSAPAIGQETVLQGQVTDEDGKPLKDVKLTLADPERGLVFHLKSDQNGKFMKVGIPPAVYQVSAELEGYFFLQSQTTIRFGFTEKIAIQLKKIPPQLSQDADLEEGAKSFREGRHDQAVESFRRVIAKFPTNYEGYYNLGLALLKKGDTDEALAALEKAVEFNPKSVETYLALGEAFFARGESEKATESFSRALELEPSSPLTHYNLGIVYYRLDRLPEAIQAFEKAIALNSSFASAYYQAALAAVKSGDYQKALRHFEEFLRIDPNAPETAQVRTMIQELKKKEVCISL
ncbi:MAG: tetratricopeptide repeat protein [Acidobacteriota bacterium]